MDERKSQPPEVDEELVAYLDGELPPERSQQIEQRLGIDPEYRRRLRDLERTWELLDELPAGEPTSAFTKSTLEMVVTQATRSQQERRRTVLTIPLRVLAFVGLPLLLCGAAFAWTRSLQNAPYQQLLRDLPVIENVDLYGTVENVRFLEMLSQEGIFAEADASQEEPVEQGGTNHVPGS